MHITTKKINLLSLHFFSIIYLMWAHEGQRGIKKGAYIKRSKVLECSINWTFMYNTAEKVRIPPNSLKNWKAQLHQSFLINTSRVASLTKSRITSMASWSFSISSPFFLSESTTAFLVVTTVTTFVTVGPDF